MKLNPDAARAAGFKGLVFHSVDFGPKLQDLIASVPPCDPSETSKSLGSSVVVIGGGKSAQEYVYIVRPAKPTSLKPHQHSCVSGQ